MSKLSKIATIVAFLGLFASCSADNPIIESKNNDNDVVQENRTVYVKVAVHGKNATGTRSADKDGNPVAEDDFQNGQGKESEVSTIYFVFYDDEGNIVGNIVNVDLSGNKNSGTAQPSVETFFENTVAVSLLKGQNKPTKVMCYVNPISLNDIQKPLSIIQTVTRNRVKSDEGLFPMSNSVYYLNTEPTTMPEVAVSVSGKVYETKKEADEATAGVDIYVERRAVRMTFKLKDNIYTGTTINQKYTSATGTVRDNSSYDLTFNIDGWDVNAQTKETYMVKSFRQPDVTPGTIRANDFNYKDADDIINKQNGDWQWNNYEYHRSYWAVSPAYFVKYYPEVSSDVTGNENLDYIKPDGYQWKTVLNGSEPQYYREATVGSNALNSGNPAAAVASIVLKGYYTINNKAIDFYTFQKDANGKFFVFPKLATDVDNGMTMKDRFMELQSVLYRKENDKFIRLTKDDLKGTKYSEIIIEHPQKTVLAADPTIEGATDMKVASRHQTLQLKGVPTDELYYASGSGYSPIDDAASLKKVNLALIQQLGFASFYNKGQAYFNIPIKHLGWYRSENKQKTLPKIDWSIVRVGDFGMVRNHAYNIEVESIEGLGTGIGNPGDPIIPPSETKDYYVKYRVNILKWAMVPKQTVNL